MTKGQSSPNKGKKMTLCAHPRCQRRLLKPVRPGREFSLVLSGREGFITIAAGEPICHFHDARMWARVNGKLCRMRFYTPVLLAAPFEGADLSRDLEINIFGSKYATVWRWTGTGWLEEEPTPVVLRDLPGGVPFLMCGEEPGSRRDAWKPEKGELVELGAGTVVPWSEVARPA